MIGLQTKSRRLKGDGFFNYPKNIKTEMIVMTNVFWGLQKKRKTIIIKIPLIIEDKIIMAETVRNPQQTRSIDKKNRIIEAGYTLFARVGYYNTNTAQIAKEAGVSTGIVYGYFHDKRDILLEVLDQYTTKVFEPIFLMADKISAPIDFDYIFSHAIDAVVETHKNNASIHAALHSLTHSDEAVNNRFTELENEMTQRLADRLVSCGYPSAGVKEKVHLAIRLIQDFSHECIYDHHDYISYPTMRAMLVDMLTYLFEKE